MSLIIDQLKKRHNNQRGDTIVEVLLAIAIISTILTGAYVVTNKSLIASRESQERGNALKLSQGQLERIKGLAAAADANDNATGIFGDSSPAKNAFCIDDTNKIVAAATNIACKVNAEGNPTTEQPQYVFSVTRGNPDKHTFTLKTTWASLKSANDNQVQLIYEAY